MPTECIPFRATNYFSRFICDYLDEANKLKPFYNRFPKLENFKKQIEEKVFPDSHRSVLVKTLQQQYQNIVVSNATTLNINALKHSNTYTVTTGHQLNLFTGPIYFLYKIISTINLCEELKKQYPENNFVPIYWMATEDHDFEEINHFYFKGEKIEWGKDFGGAVGELSTEGLTEIYEQFSKKLGVGKNAEKLKYLFKEAYLEHADLASATRYLVNELFGDYGLVIIDANQKKLKQLFIPYAEKELLEKVSLDAVSATISIFPKDYKVQVNPREINLFYIKKGLRERIVEENGKYYINNTNISWSREELLKHLYETPERFSPNVLLRPLYQEIVLPNLCYIGGGGELAYWLELKSTFEAFNVVFPMLLLRNSVLVIAEAQQKRIDKLQLAISDLFSKQNDLLNVRTKELSEINIDFTIQKNYLQEQFKELYKLAKQTDESFLGAVAAQEKKQLKGLINLEKRLLKAQKRRLNGQLGRIVAVQNELFPNQSLQERHLNFSELYLEYGDELITKLKQELKPLQGEFLVIK